MASRGSGLVAKECTTELSSRGRGRKVLGPHILQHCPGEWWTVRYGLLPHLINSAAVITLKEHPNLPGEEDKGIRMRGTCICTHLLRQPPLQPTLHWV